MCDICKQIPCSEGCPNEDKSIAYECCECNGEILLDDYYFKIGEYIYCEECIYEMRRYVM